MTDKQKECLKYFYNKIYMSAMCGRPFHMPYDNRIANSLVNRGLLVKKYSEHSEKYTGYVITEKGITLAKEMFGLIMDKSWNDLNIGFLDMGYSLSRLRENHVNNHSDELPWKQVNKANRLLFKHKDIIENNLWFRRN